MLKKRRNTIFDIGDIVKPAKKAMQSMYEVAIPPFLYTNKYVGYDPVRDHNWNNGYDPSALIGIIHKSIKTYDGDILYDLNWLDRNGNPDCNIDKCWDPNGWHSWELFRFNKLQLIDIKTILITLI